MKSLTQPQAIELILQLLFEHDLEFTGQKDFQGCNKITLLNGAIICVSTRGKVFLEGEKVNEVDRVLWTNDIIERPAVKKVRGMTDDSIMPFGKHKGIKLANIPASYFMWLDEQPWVKGDLKAYITDNKDCFKLESK